MVKIMAAMASPGLNLLLNILISNTDKFVSQDISQKGIKIKLTFINIF
jgi:hypothetical protein